MHKLSDANIEFITTDTKSLYFIKADEEQFYRVFVNLIKNSIESIADKSIKNVDYKGKISIDIKKDSDYIYITILDNGIGFDKVNKVKMLTPYFTTKKTGSGLGLAVVTKIITDHNSLIEFDTINNEARVLITIPKIYD